MYNWLKDRLDYTILSTNLYWVLFGYHVKNNKVLNIAEIEQQTRKKTVV